MAILGLGKTTLLEREAEGYHRVVVAFGFLLFTQLRLKDKRQKTMSIFTAPVRLSTVTQGSCTTR